MADIGSLEKEVTAALEDKSVSIVGIYGMCYAGKTELVEKVMMRAKRRSLFDLVLMVVVSPEGDVKGIQNQILGQLFVSRAESSSAMLRMPGPVLKGVQNRISRNPGPELETQSIASRAESLSAKFGRSGRVLVILDDVWGKIDLGQVGIPFGPSDSDSGGLKIIVITRIRSVCRLMKTQKDFEVNVLSEEVALSLFKKEAGTDLGDPREEAIGREIVGKCGGLPAVIAQVGKDLKGRGVDDWFGAADTFIKNIFSKLESSYSYLESGEAKLFFLLCSLFPEDYDIVIEDLFRYGMGLMFFQEANTLADARRRGQELVYILKDSCLLFDSVKSGCIKMNAFVRLFAISVASDLKGEHAFLVSSTSGRRNWPLQYLREHCTAISLVSSSDTSELPERLMSPKLHILLLQQIQVEIPNSFFNELKQLKVLDLSDTCISPLPSSLQFLANLQTLYLNRCQLSDVSVLGKLRKLEILSFSGSNIKELPIEIGYLSCLRLLDLTNCRDLTTSSLHVISNLPHLEELYLGNISKEWEIQESVEREVNDPESKSLPVLIITLPNDLSGLPNFSFQLKGISDATFCLHHSGLNALNFLMIRCSDKTSSDTVELTPKGNSRALKWVNVNKMFNEHLIGEVSLSKLRVLEIGVSGSVSQFGSLTSLLTAIRVASVKEEPDKLRELFLPSIARGFIELQKLEVNNCPVIEEIVADGKGEGVYDKIVLPELRFLALEDLEHLTRFCSGRYTVEWPLLKEIRVKDCPKVSTFSSGCMLQEDEPRTTATHLFGDKIAFPCLEKLSLSHLDNLKAIWHGLHPNGSFTELRDLQLDRCGKLLNVVPSHMIEWLHDLESIVASNCDSLVEVFNLVQISVMDVVLCPRLRELTLINLPKLVDIWKCPAQFSVHCNLRVLTVSNCNNVKNLFSPAMARSLFHLEELSICGCNALEEIIKTEEEEEEEDEFIWVGYKNNQNVVCLQRIKTLKVVDCHKLQYILSPSVAMSLKQLTELEIKNCKILEAVIAKEREGAAEAVHKIVFSRLTSVVLIVLPELRSFSLGRCLLEFPCLEELRLDHFTKMKGFTFGFQSGPVQQAFPLKYEQKLQISNDAPAEHFVMDKVAFPSLEELHLKHLYNLEVVCFGQLPERFYELRVLVVDCCGILSTLAPVFLVQRLKNLQKLTVRCCSSLNLIFGLDGNIPEDGNGAPMLPQLDELVLSHLPKLAHIWRKNLQSLHWMQNLKSLQVFYCNSLKSLFSVSIAGCLEQLTLLKVYGCQKIEVIMEKEEEKKAVSKIIFPRLSCLILANLPDLASFYSGSYSFRWPSLETVRLKGCPKMKTFATQEQITPELRAVEVAFIQNLWMGDINKTIQSLYRSNDLQASEVLGVKERQILYQKLDIKPSIIFDGAGWEEEIEVVSKEKEETKVVCKKEEEIEVVSGKEGEIVVVS